MNDNPGEEDDGKPVCESADEQGLYEIFSAEEIERGIYVYEAEALLNSITSEVRDNLESYWETECDNNLVNNPEAIKMP